MSEAIDDQTYEEVFSIEHEAERGGVDLIDDPYSIWARLLEQAPVHRGASAS